MPRAYNRNTRAAVEITPDLLKKNNLFFSTGKGILVKPHNKSKLSLSFDKSSHA